MQTQAYTDQELSLIDAIHAVPHDDEPRLAYAEWLERSGDETSAEFIRLQCQKPYIAISNRHPKNPHKSFSFDFPGEDRTAEDRLQRLLTLLPTIYVTPRFAPLANLRYYEEFYRGLSLLEIRGNEYGLDSDHVGHEPLGLPHLSRARLTLNIDRSRLSRWLEHPLMLRVDELQLWLDCPPYKDLDDESRPEEQFDVEEIRILADWRVLPRLRTLSLCAPISAVARPLVAELLEPHVVVKNWW